jgi:hypothetical protein
MDAVGGKRCFPLHDGKTGCCDHNAQDDHDRRDLPERTPYEIEPAGKKGISGGSSVAQKAA